MNYYENIRALTKNVPTTLVDFELPRDPARIPTQASSNFITNKEQGDWAERLIMTAINETSKNFVAVKYGKSDDLIAGEDGFDTFYQAFQNELDTIGKRPDLLIFKKSDFDAALGLDISQIPHSQVTEYVKKAVAGIEVRSSNYLSDRYETAMQTKIENLTRLALEIKDKILSDCVDLLEHPSRRKYIPILRSITPETINITDFKVPSWRSSTQLVELSGYFKTLKNLIRKIPKRTKLSITVKNEDLQVVYKWIETFNVPHFYFQVFFDKVIGLSFEEIIQILSNPENEDVLYRTEKNKKNQDKPTIHIFSSNSLLIASKVEEPEHKSIRRELNMGQLLFYVKFSGGTAYLDVDNLRNILGINEADF